MSTNPYQTPEGQLTTDDLAYGEIKFFSPSSRINRLRYWAHSMLFTFAMIGVFIVLSLVTAFVSQVLGIILIVLAYVAMVVFGFILIVQRLHDLNKTGWLSLLALVPFANIYLMVLLVFFKGTEGRNNYGLQTPPNKPWHWVMALSFPALMLVIGILAAIALPAYQGYVERQGLNYDYSQDGYQNYDQEYSQDEEYPQGEEYQQDDDSGLYEDSDSQMYDELPEDVDSDSEE